MQDRELYQQILGLESPWSVSGFGTAHRVPEGRVG
ncbi:hypothetical protein K2D_19860 [Planctomycetes bacterium K2D]|nr:hypothetical protein K2D_19860 [Planctomycetes bacterium K2D]